MTEERWPIWQRVALRFGVVFGVLALVPLFFDHIPRIGDWLEGRWYALSELVVDAFGRNVLGTGPIHHAFTGSGDTLFDYVHLLVLVLLALAGTIAWSILDRRRLAYPRLATAARIVLRYWLAMFMLVYGFDKVFGAQFPPPNGARQLEPVGHMSPQGMLWTFMGASLPYQVFGGVMECLGAVLLLSRRTTLAGALVLAPVLVNVVMLNFCYDVPVKRFSSELLLATLVLIAPDAKRLVAVVLGREATRASPSMAWPRRYWLASRIAKAMVIVALVYYPLHDELDFLASARKAARPFGGIWQVEKFVRDGVEVPPLATDATRWKLVIIGRYNALVRTVDDRDRVDAIADGDPASFALSALAASFTAEYSGDRLVLTGTLDHHPTRIELRRRDDSDMLLVHRGFQWIQELPFNR